MNNKLTNAQVRVDAGVTSGAGQVFVLTVRDVEMGLRVAIFLGQPEINHIHLVSALADAHQEIVGLDVAVNE